MPQSLHHTAAIRKDTASRRSIAPVTEALRIVLNETYQLILDTQSCHWNVTGPQFYSLHEMTEAQYSDMFRAVDLLAERIRTLGEPAYVDLRGRNSAVVTDQSTDDMLHGLLQGHEALSHQLHALVRAADAADDPVTADLATNRAAFHDTAAWILRATTS
ncbi:DNA starvation/stationary phase protection protein [Gymnodinialimonas sp. 57CJ19]|uniref:Dps family protein n=1 Tax=Gymnodinialimonas sp. 57CJ19 TaxID=3138498 RepID=UPI0031344E80